MPTTLGDYGRHSEKFGDISFYYAFAYRFYFGEHQIAPEDVHTWCKENCVGYYKITGYTHESSVRRKRSKEFDSKVVYADKVYLADEKDALRLKLAYDVKETIVKRPRIKRFKSARKAKSQAR